MTLPPLSPWQQQVAGAILRGEPITLSIPRRNGRATIARHVEAQQPARTAEPETFPTGFLACDSGCCRVIRSRGHRPPGLFIEGRQYIRPMFEVLSLPTAPDLDDEDGMRVPASEYDRPDRIFL